jgi:hypothetical protein
MGDLDWLREAGHHVEDARGSVRLGDYAGAVLDLAHSVRCLLMAWYGGER